MKRRSDAFQEFFKEAVFVLNTKVLSLIRNLTPFIQARVVGVSEQEIIYEASLLMANQASTRFSKNEMLCNILENNFLNELKEVAAERDKIATQVNQVVSNMQGYSMNIDLTAYNVICSFAKSKIHNKTVNLHLINKYAAILFGRLYPNDAVIDENLRVSGVDTNFVIGLFTQEELNFLRENIDRLYAERYVVFQRAIDGLKEMIAQTEEDDSLAVSDSSSSEEEGDDMDVQFTEGAVGDDMETREGEMDVVNNTNTTVKDAVGGVPVILVPVVGGLPFTDEFESI